MTDRGAAWARTTLPCNLEGNSDGRYTGIPAAANSKYLHSSQTFKFNNFY
jgi:hypothetical protein